MFGESRGMPGGFMKTARKSDIGRRIAAFDSTGSGPAA